MPASVAGVVVTMKLADSAPRRKRGQKARAKQSLAPNDPVSFRLLDIRPLDRNISPPLAA
jgi:hypothetical protein